MSNSKTNYIMLNSSFHQCAFDPIRAKNCTQIQNLVTEQTGTVFDMQLQRLRPSQKKKHEIVSIATPVLLNENSVNLTQQNQIRDSSIMNSDANRQFRANSGNERRNQEFYNRQFELTHDISKKHNPTRSSLASNSLYFDNQPGTNIASSPMSDLSRNMRSSHSKQNMPNTMFNKNASAMIIPKSNVQRITKRQLQPTKLIPPTKLNGPL